MNIHEEKRKPFITAWIEKTKEKAGTIRKELADKNGRKKWLSVFAECALYAAYGFLFSSGKMLFGAYPLGIALLSSATKGLPFIFAGAIAAGLVRGQAGVPLIVVCCVLLALRLRLKVFYGAQDRIPAKEEPLGVRLALAVTAAFAVGIVGCIAERFTMHALMALLFYMLASGSFAFLYAGSFGAFRKKPLYRKVSQIAMLFSLVFGCTAFRILTFSPAAALAAFLCFYCAETGDLLSCGVLGLALGVACGRDYAPVMALLGLVTGALWKYSSRTAPWLGILAGFAWAFYSKGTSAFLYVLPDLVCGLLVYIPVSAYRSKKKEAVFESAGQAGNGNDGASPPAVPFEELSRQLTALSGRLRLPDREDALRVTDAGMENACGACRGGCRKNKELVSSLSDVLFETGALSYDLLPRRFPDACPQKEALISRTNALYKTYLRRLSGPDGCDCYARCCKSFAKISNDREEQKSKETGVNAAVTARLEKALKKLGIGYETCRAEGARALVLTVENVNISDLGKSAGQLRELFEAECDLKLSMPELRCEDGGTTLIFRRRICRALTVGIASETKEGESQCGDSVTSLTCGGYSYLLLSDGMGSGKEAALFSDIACRFFEQLAECGAKSETILLTINDFLLSTGYECCTTVDLLQLDLYDGTCRFYKCGASPSLLLRGQNVFKLSEENIPLGAAEEISCEPVTLNLKPGDLVLTMSDGAADEIESAPFLPDLTEGKLGSDPQPLAEALLKRSENARAKPDDRTVLVARIEEID